MYFIVRKGFMQKGFSTFMTCHFLQSIWQRDKESFLFNTYIYLTILLFFPTIKTHIISLQSVINNMYTSHVDRYEGKKKRFQCENMHSVIIVVCQGKQSFFRFVSLLKNFFYLSEEKKNISTP